MSGLVKPKQYDWKDSNLAMFGSDEEKKLKKSAAMKEPAWTGCENFEGTKIWRIEKFKVKDWPKSEYGKFFDGDSYIILHSEKDPDSNELDFDVHFWIGGSSTQDEYGAAAYKTLELDTYLDDKAIQHREVGGKESEEFLGYFGGKITIEEGGIDSGFNHVVPSEERLPFTRNLLKHFKKIPNKEGKMEYHAVDMPYTQKNLCCDDGYVVIFSEDKMYQVKGKNAKIDSICPFNEWMSVQKHEHPRAKLQVYESLNELFGTEVYKNAPADFVVKLIRVLTDKSKAEFRVVAEGVENISEDLLDSDDVFLLEAPDRLFVTFLYPKKDRCKAEDEVRVLSAEGGLSAELSKHPVLTCMESDGPRTIVMGFGRLVSWSEEDDAAEVARERVALLELSQAGVNLMEFTRIMAEQLPQDQEGLDLVEESVAQAKETTRQAVETLSGAAAAEYDHREKLVWPGAGLVMLGGLLFCTCPSGAPALLCAAGRGALFVGATLGSMSTLSKLQMRTLEQIQERLPARSILEKLPLEQAKQIREACDEANKRLHARLDDQDAWEEEPFLSRAFAADFHVWDREVGNDLAVKRGRSDARRGDYSYVFTFNVDIPVSRAFKVVQQMSLIGSLDPGCKVMWSRPVDAASDNTHYIRYVAFAEWFYSRDFCTACHCGPANHPNEHKECYTLATSSLSDELREVEGVPKLRGEQSGHIDVVGVRLTENESGTRVEVMADVDPAAPVTYFTRVVNKRIRNHTRDAAWLIQCALKQAKDSGATVSLQE